MTPHVKVATKVVISPAEWQARLDLATCFAVAYDRIAADEEVNYGAEPPPPALSKNDITWTAKLLRDRRLRKNRPNRGKRK